MEGGIGKSQEIMLARIRCNYNNFPAHGQPGRGSSATNNIRWSNFLLLRPPSISLAR
jgi:hypothetical protein